MSEKIAHGSDAFKPWQQQPFSFHVFRVSFVRFLQTPVFPAVLFCLLLFSSEWKETSAAIITYEFSGTVNDVADELTSRFSVGDELIGTFQVDESAANFISDRVTVYDSLNFSAVVGDDYFISSATARTRVIDETVDPRQDLFLFDSAPGDGITGDDVNSHELDSFTIHLRYPANTLNSTDLLDEFVFPSGSDLSSIRFDLDDDLRVSFDMNNVTAVVPEPPLTQAFSLLAPLALTYRWRHRRRKDREQQITIGVG